MPNASEIANAIAKSFGGADAPPSQEGQEDSCPHCGKKASDPKTVGEAIGYPG